MKRQPSLAQQALPGMPAAVRRLYFYDLDGDVTWCARSRCRLTAIRDLPKPFTLTLLEVPAGPKRRNTAPTRYVLCVVRSGVTRSPDFQVVEHASEITSAQHDSMRLWMQGNVLRDSRMSRGGLS